MICVLTYPVAIMSLLFIHVTVLIRVSTKGVWKEKGKKIEITKTKQILNLTRKINYALKDMLYIHEVLMILFMCVFTYV